ncbi:UDP-N-acetylmuramoyl-L-alanyl-D-glutamate--2,6-diaminopimelate ligase [Halomonas sp. 328]|uniref:UDP-N-acetylmuramoyl-L-alanyl-D-glutamate--2, 6-diaminopimelate ligase n=1 Tax=Halomonas sp. 328 TaxID=2776704 RepID=UPI0018A71B86|nr:UDP-N-acetylmuramoyl-L-alanyl-D-glutamate--2,6-diaminopimelate ligase [Halomonas sp. 328]MBF8223070.1 UDP-N-acetylmuramoyl-L-alanyl-D-glutamate--2,6-diaminopimelate ligase [Halomonas sp. 328]
MQVESQHLGACLARLWPDCHPTLPAGPRRLVLDSRTLSEGDVFLALPGVQQDGREHIAAALAAGAALVLCHQPESGADMTPPEDARVWCLPGLKERQGELGRALFRVPVELPLIGVTGTNGKSSVTHYVALLSEALGTPCGMIGTLGHGRPGRLAEGEQTTPGPLALQAQLGELVAQGARRVVMEVSSHALEQDRLQDTRVTAAGFTNLSRDHLDYHGSMAAYAAAKARLFRRPELELVVVNGDDPLARLMLAGVPKQGAVRVLATGRDEATTLRVLDWWPHARGQRALVAGPEGEFALELPLMGRFNLDNVLLAMALLHGLGESLSALVEAAGRLTPVPGRMQLLSRPGCPGVVVDYAHTPDALDNALGALRDHLGSAGRLWCLFGCGGDRDPGKRPLMGAAAAARADHLVITDDNPRGEAPAAIRAAIREGLGEFPVERLHELAGRGAAIAWVIAQAAPGDVVLLAGKGHETYQEIAGIKHPFCDREVAEAALEARP